MYLYGAMGYNLSFPHAPLLDQLVESLSDLFESWVDYNVKLSKQRKKALIKHIQAVDTNIIAISYYQCLRGRPGISFCSHLFRPLVDSASRMDDTCTESRWLSSKPYIKLFLVTNCKEA
ncbi:hypothetical protein NEOLEDRAFT_1143602 [Neolentinus lepideus HHB14362 ss-1]|uniref:Uncharacterized protein n=1 Tax=Neolentinus lepideus HHB14362 ss-1 TaxID=1314782 RepID=A0A165MFZ0_9AGAM|nr:hypothetical protein NEOLEDRAFT_1143602 [Neolentinus lepideus HHB14362 ss-1]